MSECVCEGGRGRDRRAKHRAGEKRDSRGREGIEGRAGSTSGASYYVRHSAPVGGQWLQGLQPPCAPNAKRISCGNDGGVRVSYVCVSE